MAAKFWTSLISRITWLISGPWTQMLDNRHLSWQRTSPWALGGELCGLSSSSLSTQ
jgi:hypothetical protein